MVVRSEARRPETKRMFYEEAKNDVLIINSKIGTGDGRSLQKKKAVCMNKNGWNDRQALPLT